MMPEWNEAEHPRDEDGKFTFKNGENQQNDTDKMQNRADAIYGSDEEYNKKYKSSSIRESQNFETRKLGGTEMASQQSSDKQKGFNPIDNTKFSDSTWEKTRIFITDAEDFIPVAKRPLKDDVLTIGYGHTEGVKEGDTITREQAMELYKQDFSKYNTPLKYVNVPLNDNEKVALTSFIYNIGPTAFKNSTLLKKLNNGDKQGAANEFDKWIYKNGRIVKGLVNRRLKEKELFLTPDKQ